ncbi:MAG TPA: DUF2884 family protein [Arenimonas sp.]|nr:DUF2884 family protein [Arenimonas sp.]
MSLNHRLSALLLAATATFSIGCSAESVSDTAKSTSSRVADAISEAKQELATKDFRLHADGLPEAALTPEGLRIDGRLVELDAKQQALLQDYRGALMAVAEAGIDIGSQGVDLAGKAIAESITSVLSGNEEQTRARIEAEAEKLKTSALALCDRLPVLLEAQRKLADAVPQFAPYARMDEQDVEKCRVEGVDDSDLQIEV